MRILCIALLGALAAPTGVMAANCTNVPQSMPVRAGILGPIANELSPDAYALGAQSSVLAQAFDEAQSVDQVLLRQMIASCHNIAKAAPISPTGPIDPNDPAAYKPQTAFDNTPWRFNMSQNGKRMTADEFTAWMKSRGVRVAKGAPGSAGALPAAGTLPTAAPADPSAAAAVPAAVVVPAAAPVPATPAPTP